MWGGRRGAAVAIGVCVLAGAAASPLPVEASSSVTASPVTVSVDASHLGPALNEALIGTNQPVAAAASVMQPLGVHWARTDMSLDAGYSCSTGKWDPTALDGRVQADLAMGGTPELLVSYSPPCMTTNPLHETLDPPDANGYGPWQALVEQAAYHEMVTYRVHIFEVWNEPDGTFWHGTLLDYLALYRATASALEAAAARAGISDLLVGGPALVFPDPVWLEPFLTYVDANRLPLGFVSWHYYGDYPALGPFQTSAAVFPPELPGAGPYWYNPLLRAQSYGQGVQLVKALLATHPSLHPLTVLDEWNLDAGYDPRADTAYDAAFAAAVLDSVQSAGLDRAAFFRVADDRPGTLGNWGMLFSNLAPKPVYWTFYFWHLLAGATLPVAISPSQVLADLTGRIGAVASAGPGRASLSVMLYDFAPYDPTGGYGTVDPNPYDHPVTVSVAGLRKGRWTYSLRMIDASHAGTEVAGGPVHEGTVLVPMAGESVALLQLTRS